MNSSSNDLFSLSLIRLIGYGLLTISLVYVVDILIPPQFTNPVWEFGIVALLLERIPLPLVGLAMVFWGGAELRSVGEMLLLKLFSWSTLIVGILCLLLIPLGISSALRINAEAKTQIVNQYEQQISQLEQAEIRVESANEEQLNLFAEALREQEANSDLLTPREVRIRLNEEIDQAREDIAANREISEQSQSVGLRKNLLKWVLISLLSAYIFIYIWRLTLWVRKFKL